MDRTVRDLPVGDLRVSDADRDLALSELSEALQVGRITAGEFDQRSGQALSARTGKELTALLADLPLDRVPAARVTTMERGDRVPAARITIGASAAAAGALASVAAANALSGGGGPDLQKRELVRAILGREGLSIPLSPASAPGFDWVGTVTPAAFAVLCVVVLIILLRVTSARRLST